MPGFLLLVSVALGVGAALLAGEWLLTRSRIAQELIVTVISTLGWPGSSILVTLSVGFMLFSLIETALWPAAQPWRTIRRRFGVAAAVAATLLWGVVALVEVLMLYNGVAVRYVGMLTELGLPAPAWGLPLAGIVLGSLLALLPEWIALRSLTALYRALLR